MRSSLPFALAIAGLAACAEPELVMRDEVIKVPITSTWTRALEPDGPPILYLNRCIGGCRVRKGLRDDSRYDISSILTTTITLPEYPHGDDEWEATVRCVQEMFAPFELIVTDVDPGTAPHFENYVAGTPRGAGFDPTIAGVASFACGVIPNAVSFSFAGVITGAESACVVIAHEAGHNFGLQHEYLCLDPMTYLEDCGERSFQRADAQCGEFLPRACDCGVAYQNSYLYLMEVFGKRTTPLGYGPYVEIIDPRYDGDDVDPRFLVFVEAEDDVRIERVELLIDGEPAGTSTLAPYVYRMRDGLAEGEHTLLARAFDNEGLIDTATRTVNLVLPKMPIMRRDAGFDVPDVALTFPDAALTPDADPEVDAGVDPMSLEEGGCACSAAGEQPGSGAPLAFFVLALAILARRRSIACLLLLGACTGGDDLGFVGANLELDPPPGTLLRFQEVILQQTKPDPVFITAKSVGPGSIRFEPRPSIEGSDSFYVSASPRVLAPSQSGKIYARFRPTTTGTISGELVIHSNDRTQLEVRYPLEGYAREPCVLDMSPKHQRIEVGETKTITIRTGSSYRCVLTRLTTDFTLFDFVDLPPLPVVIEPGEEVEIRVKHTQRTTKPGVPIRHVIAHEREGTEAFVSFEGQPAAFNCIGAFPPELELPTGPLGVPVRGRVLVTNRCDTRVHILAAYVTIGVGIYSVAPGNVPLGVDPFGFAGLYVVYEPFTDVEDRGVLVLQTDDALVPRIEIALKGKGILPREYSIAEIDFGDVSYENPGPDGLSACLSKRTVPIFSGGSAELVVRDVALDPMGDPGFSITGATRDGAPVELGQPIIIAPGGRLDVAVEFSPARLNPAEHENTLSIRHTAISSTSRVRLFGRAVRPGAARDNFVAGPPRADVLFIVDNSLSMETVISELEANAAVFLDLAESRNTDYQIAVVPADTRSSLAGWFRRCSVRSGYVSDEQGDATARRMDLSCRFHVGSRGLQLQSGIAASMLALEHAIEPTEPGFEPSINSGFVRDGAKLVLVMISNDDDQSTESIDTAYGFYTAIKRRRDLVEVHAIAGPVENACAGGAPWTVPGVKYKALADLTGGTFWDICATDAGAALQGIAEAALRPESTFSLSRRAEPSTIRVEVGGVVVFEDPIDGYTFDAIDNSVSLHGASVPAPGTSVSISYNADCSD